MQIIDITNQKQVPYVFADEATTLIDKRLTRRILQKVNKHLVEFISVAMRPNSVSFISKNRRSCRIILYDLEKLTANENLFVVVFYANKRSNITEIRNKEFYESDWKIAMSMMGNNTILCYASQELSDGNWFNIVLFTKESDKHSVTTHETHMHAAYTLAPQRFDWIRLHNAYLPEGIIKYKSIILEKTKYYNFDENWFAVRNYKPSMKSGKEEI